MWSIYARPRAAGRVVPSKAQIRSLTASSKEAISKANLEAEGDVAKRLRDTNIWTPRRTTKRAKIAGDRSRVNVTSEKLCGTCPRVLAISRRLSF